MTRSVAARGDFCGVKCSGRRVGSATRWASVDFCDNDRVLNGRRPRRKLIAAAAAESRCWRCSTAACGTRVSAPPARQRPAQPRPAARRRPRPATRPPTSASRRPPITVGVLVSRTSPLGPDVFSGSYYGATAYFDTLNAQGGINGRKVKVVSCDDTGSGSGNVSCVHTADRPRPRSSRSPAPPPSATTATRT